MPRVIWNLKGRLPYATPFAIYVSNSFVYKKMMLRSNSIRLAVCILHYGKNEMTKHLHTQLLANEPLQNGNVFVLDNASPESYPNSWRRLPENIFWAGAFAYALVVFHEAGYTHLWFCNNDISFVSAPPYIERIKARLQWLEKQGRVGLYSPSVTSNPYHRQMICLPGGECRKVRYVDGIAPVVSLACAREIGGLDFAGNPYGYGVDVFFSLCADAAGWGIWVDHSLVLRHKYHATASLQEGFLSESARAEEAYMTKRLGCDWRERLLAMQAVQERIP
ncbi:hypothetical protein FACS1894206_07240 [Deltaproteobacteria bacterium]|nr:hypothetical protein FACS1894206_07240 [Deltaproteobacteria bacterium]